MKKNLEILEVEPKLKKDESKYWRFKTSDTQGGASVWMNVFDVGVADKLKEFQFKGELACVEMTEKPGTNFKGEAIVFKNITKCYGEAEEVGMGDTAMNVNKYIDEPSRSDQVGLKERKPEVVRMIDKEGTSTYPKKNGNATMYTSYAKDIFCARCETLSDKDNYSEADLMDMAIELVKQAREAFE